MTPNKHPFPATEGPDDIQPRLVLKVNNGRNPIIIHL